MTYYSHFLGFLTTRYFIYLSVFLSFWLGLGSVPLFDLDEGAFTEATREMLASGVFSATYLDGEPRYDKPIFFYWLQALSIKTFGFNEWAFRLPSVLAACAWAWALHRFVNEFYDKTRAQIATLFLINCLWIALIARSAIADALLNLFLSLTLFDIWRYIQYKRSPYLFRIYFWMALGTLTKGPVAVVVPLGVSTIYLFSQRQIIQYLRCYLDIRGWLIFIAVVSPWLVSVYLEQGTGFFQGFIVEHNLKRFSATRESHGGSIFYYIAALPFILMPLSGLLYFVGKNTKKLIGMELERFLLIWFLLIFIIFSMSKTQLPHYILNSCVPLIILLATVAKLNNESRWTPIFAFGVALVFVFLPEVLAYASLHSDEYEAAALSNYQEALPAYYRVFALMLLSLIGLVWVLPKLLTWQRLALCGLLLNVFVFTQIVGIASQIQQRPIHQAIAFLDQHHRDAVVVAYKMHMPSFSVYREKITPLRAPKPGEIALVRVDRIKRLQTHLGQQPHKIIFQSGGLALVSVYPEESASNE